MFRAEHGLGTGKASNVKSVGQEKNSQVQCFVALARKLDLEQKIDIIIRRGQLCIIYGTIRSLQVS